MDIEMLLNGPFWVIDFLPFQVPADGKGQFFFKSVSEPWG